MCVLVPRTTPNPAAPLVFDHTDTCHLPRRPFARAFLVMSMLPWLQTRRLSAASSSTGTLRQMSRLSSLQIDDHDDDLDEEIADTWDRLEPKACATCSVTVGTISYESYYFINCLQYSYAGFALLLQHVTKAAAGRLDQRKFLSSYVPAAALRQGGVP